MEPASWQVRPFEATQVDVISKSFDLPEAVAQILVGRGIWDPKEIEIFLSRSMKDLAGPAGLQGVEAAAQRVSKAIATQEKIVVHGDFDADGITSTAVLTRFLLDVGAQVVPYIPNRLQDGHGISNRSIAFIEAQQAKLVITCDCGVSNAKEIGQLSQKGIETIVTDHHAIPDEMPVNTIVVNPKLTAQGEEPDDLSGVGVAFMLVISLRAKLRDQGFFKSQKEPNLKEYLDIVALGTLADMAPIKGQNRILVHHGLQQILTSTRAGIIAMKSSSGLDQAITLETEDVGFRLAPRINAAARLGFANEALELLMTTETSVAQNLAVKIEAWNQERKKRQEEMTRLAMEEATRQVQMGKKSIVVGSRLFHPGIIGLVAQKISQHFGLPTFVFAMEGEVSRGSARCSSGVSVVELLQDAAPLLIQFGGHKEAGGCSLETGKVEAFAQKLEEVLKKKKIDASREVFVDAELNLRHLNREFLVALSRLKPFGMGNLEPLLLSGAKVVGRPREVGKGHLKMMLSDPTGGSSFSAIGFGLWSAGQAAMQENVDVVYTPEINRFDGRELIQLRLRGVRSV